MDTATPANHLSIHIELGQLTWAGNAVPGYYHVQDLKTLELHQVPLSQPLPWSRRLKATIRRQWSRSAWMKPAAGLVAGVLVVGAVGLYQSGRAKVEAGRQRDAVAAIPIVPAAPRPPSSGVSVVPGAYVEERPSAPLPAFEAPRTTVVAPAPLPESLPRQLPAAPVPLRLEPPPSAPARTAPAPAPKPAPKEDSPVIVNEDTPPPAARQQKDLAAAAQVTSAPAPQAPKASASLATLAAPVPAPRLVAIQDAQTILVTSPTTRLPIRVVLGGPLPNGRKVTAIDAAKGTVTLDNGSLLALD